jgi:hypothetical protein
MENDGTDDEGDCSRMSVRRSESRKAMSNGTEDSIVLGDGKSTQRALAGQSRKVSGEGLG